MVIHSWHAARPIRQHRLIGKPLMVREFVAHDSAPFVSLEFCRFFGHEPSTKQQEVGAIPADIAPARLIASKIAQSLVVFVSGL